MTDTLKLSRRERYALLWLREDGAATQALDRQVATLKAMARRPQPLVETVYEDRPTLDTRHSRKVGTRRRFHRLTRLGLLARAKAQADFDAEVALLTDLKHVQTTVHEAPA